MHPYRPVYLDQLLEPWRWRSFPELKGLGLRCLAEAMDGSMWFGVDEGVCRYDGVNWTTYTRENGLYGAPVNVLLAARDGSIYAGTEMGISRFDRDAWSPVFPPGAGVPWYINDLMEASDGSIWAGTAWGALHLSQGDPVLYTSDEMGAALQVLASYLQLSFVPDEVAPSRPWGEAIGVRMAEGAGMGLRRGSIPKIVWAVAPGGPGDVAGLKVGDGIVSLNRSQPILFNDALTGPANTSVVLTVEREHIAQPFEVTVTRKHVEARFQEFSVAHVCEDREGALWLGLESGEIVCGQPHSDQTGATTAWQLYAAEDGLDIGRVPQS